MTKKLERILYVEDDEDISQLVQMALEDFGGFKIKHFSNPKLALNNFKDFKPDLVITDIMMPEISGIEFFEKIRQSEEGKKLPGIFMTAKAQNHERESYMKIDGILGVIIKPFKIDELCLKVNQLWEGRNV